MNEQVLELLMEMRAEQAKQGQLLEESLRRVEKTERSLEDLDRAVDERFDGISKRLQPVVDHVARVNTVAWLLGLAGAGLVGLFKILDYFK